MNKIPKIANFYWGNQKMSFLRFLTIFSFVKYNPDWEIVLYTSPINNKEFEFRKTDFHSYDAIDYKNEKDYRQMLPKKIKIIEFDFKNYSFIYNDLSEAHKSDIIGWEVLSSTGGIWIDMDVIFIKSLKDSCLNFKENDTFICFDERILNLKNMNPCTPIGFLCASQNNELYKRILEKCRNNYLIYNYQCLGAELMSDVLKNIQETRLKFPNLKIQTIDPKLIYKNTYLEIEKIFKIDCFSDYINDNAIGIHWYGGHELSCQYNNFYDHTNYKKLGESTLTRAIDLLK